MTLNETLIAACRAHAPQFDRMDAEIRKHAMEQMRSALLSAITDLVLASRSVLADGLPEDMENSDLVRALEPFEELVAYDDNVEASISVAMASEPSPDLCEDEGCDHHGTAHACSPTPSPRAEGGGK